jgi:hypothetical protein
MNTGRNTHRQENEESIDNIDDEIEYEQQMNARESLATLEQRIGMDDTSFLLPLQHERDPVEYHLMTQQARYHHMLESVSHDMLRYQYMRDTAINDEIRIYFEQLIQSLSTQRNGLLLCMGNNNFQRQLHFETNMLQNIGIADLKPPCDSSKPNDAERGDET